MGSGISSHSRQKGKQLKTGNSALRDSTFSLSQESASTCVSTHNSSESISSSESSSQLDILQKTFSTSDSTNCLQKAESDSCVPRPVPQIKPPVVPVKLAMALKRSRKLSLDPMLLRRGKVRPDISNGCVIEKGNLEEVVEASDKREVNLKRNVTFYTAGHEHPYAIRMNQLRESGKATSTLDLESVQADEQGAASYHFILREKKKSDSSSKVFGKSA